MSITAAMVKELRAQSGAGIMDAKNALKETNGDIEAAIDWLRSKGKAKAAKKSSRSAADGLVGVYVEGSTGVIVEVNSETDFVAKNIEFRKLVDLVRRTALESNSLDELLAAKPTGKELAEEVTDKITTLGENLSVSRLEKLSGMNIASYVHTSVEDGMGKIAVLVSYDGPQTELGKQVAMHVAATNPVALSEAEVAPDTLRREKQILRQKALDAGKPEGIVQKIVEGGIRKYLAEETLVNQKFVINPEHTVQSACQAEEITLTGYIRVKVGESSS